MPHKHGRICSRKIESATPQKATRRHYEQNQKLGSSPQQQPKSGTTPRIMKLHTLPVNYPPSRPPSPEQSVVRRPTSLAYSPPLSGIPPLVHSMPPATSTSTSTSTTFPANSRISTTAGAQANITSHNNQTKPSHRSYTTPTLTIAEITSYVQRARLLGQDRYAASVRRARNLPCPTPTTSTSTSISAQAVTSAKATLASQKAQSKAQKHHSSSTSKPKCRLSTERCAQLEALARTLHDLAYHPPHHHHHRHPSLRTEPPSPPRPLLRLPPRLRAERVMQGMRAALGALEPPLLGPVEVGMGFGSLRDGRCAKSSRSASAAAAPAADEDGDHDGNDDDGDSSSSSSERKSKSAAAIAKKRESRNSADDWTPPSPLYLIVLSAADASRCAHALGAAVGVRQMLEGCAPPTGGHGGGLRAEGERGVMSALGVGVVVLRDVDEGLLCAQGEGSEREEGEGATLDA